MDISVPVGHEITGVSFSFIDSEEVKRVSVKRIINPVTFDPITNQPTQGGLYDPALGPYDKSQMYVN